MGWRGSRHSGGLDRGRQGVAEKVLIPTDSKAAIAALKKAGRTGRPDPDTCKKPLMTKGEGKR